MPLPDPSSPSRWLGAAALATLAAACATPPEGPAGTPAAARPRTPAPASAAPPPDAGVALGLDPAPAPASAAPPPDAGVALGLDPAPAPTSLAEPTPATDPPVLLAPAVPDAHATVTGHLAIGGKAPGAPIALSLQRWPAGKARPVEATPDGVFSATDLEPGAYVFYYYNDERRGRVGFWRSRPLTVAAGATATFPPVDLGLPGELADPRPEAKVALPVSFAWHAPAQPVDGYRVRLHSAPGRAFTLLYVSAALDPAATAWQWDGERPAGSPPLPARVYWGVHWDAGPAGEGGGLFQPLKLELPE